MNKSITSILTAVISSIVMLFIFVGCDLTPSLQLYANEINKECPKDFGEGFVINKVEIAGDYLVFQSKVDENNSVFALVFMDELSEAFSEKFKEEFLSNENLGELLKQCKKENKGIKMTVTGDKTGKTANLFEVTPEEIQNMEI